MTYEEYFKRHTELIYRNVGVSMLPMLKQGRDLFILKRKQIKDVKSMMLFCITENQGNMFCTE